jgi:hypothetical protein
VETLCELPALGAEPPSTWLEAAPLYEQHVASKLLLFFDGPALLLAKWRPYFRYQLSETGTHTVEQLLVIEAYVSWLHANSLQEGLPEEFVFLLFAQILADPSIEPLVVRNAIAQYPAYYAQHRGEYADEEASYEIKNRFFTEVIYV